MKGNRLLLAVLAGVLLLATLAYAPGLRGDFLFDDFVNLDALGATGPVDDWPTFWRYLSSGTADPTGRPLALLSFLLDARDWPAQPGPFLRTNLALHLANGVMLSFLLRRLGGITRAPGRRVDAAALLAAAGWLLHPLLVSTTLYIVQREAILAAGACLGGLLAYVHFRVRFSETGGTGALVGAGLTVLAATLLAMACKANGVLMPVLALSLEASVLRRLPAPAPERLRRLRWAVLGLPTALLAAYLASFLVHWNLFLPERGWTIAQRLLSQPRALASYLQLWFVPRSMSSGLYNDAFMPSVSLLAPASTLLALLLVAGLLTAGWRARERFPAFAAALGFFFAGHLLESSSLPLELYFEHRNYLPAMLLFWPIALSLAHWQAPRGARVAIGLAALLLLAATTLQRTQLWGDPQRLAQAWVAQNPGSSRAQATAAAFDVNAGRAASARARMRPLWRAHPRDLQLAFNYINAACASGGIAPGEAARLEDALATAASTRLMNRWLGDAIDSAAAGDCPGLELAVAHAWLEAMARNPVLRPGTDRDQELEPLRGRLALRQGDPEAALLHYDLALRAFVTPDVAARQAAELARAGAYAQAMAHLDEYERLKSQAHRPAFGMPRVHAWVLQRQGYWPREMAILRAKLRAELAAAGNAP